MYFPAESEPTNEMARMAGSSQIQFTTSRLPCTMLSTPLHTGRGAGVEVRVEEEGHDYQKQTERAG